MSEERFEFFEAGFGAVGGAGDDSDRPVDDRRWDAGPAEVAGCAGDDLFDHLETSSSARVGCQRPSADAVSIGFDATRYHFLCHFEMPMLSKVTIAEWLWCR